jgi:GxxExxY protein
MSQRTYEPIPEADEAIAHRILGAAIEVHRELGLGFLERIYERALEHELSRRGLIVERQKEILVTYKDIAIPGLQLDILVDGRVIVELKAVDMLAPIHYAQILSYLKATNLRLGLLINFHERLLMDGAHRVVR